MKPDVETVYGLNNTLLGGLSHEDVSQLCTIMNIVCVPAGGLFIQEGEKSDSVYLIQDGEVEVIKREAEHDVWYTLAKLKTGESVGEVSLLDNEPRSASVRASVNTELLEIKLEDLNTLSSGEESISSRIKVNFAKETSQRLRNTNETTVRTLHDQLAEAKARVAMGTIICWLLVGICCYVVVLKTVTSMASSSDSTTIISVLILVVFGAMTFAAAKRTVYPLSFYGLTLQGWRTSLLESILFSLPILALIVIVKWALVRFHPGMQEETIFGFVNNLRMAGWAVVIDILLYSIFTPIQEFIARGGVQSSFQEFLSGKHKKLIALLIANLMFSMTHLHLSTTFAAMVFVPGLFWGWLYYRRNTLIGVCVSHLLIGLFAYYVVGFNSLLQ